MPFSRNISPQRTRSSQRLFKIFFLGVLSVLCGELLCFFFDLIGRFFGRRLGGTLLPRVLRWQKKWIFFSYFAALR
jgi:hypothetical protein